MGWCSATIIFDVVCEGILDNPALHPESQEITIKRLFEELRRQDWDCECDSVYADHPIVKKLLEGRRTPNKG